MEEGKTAPRYDPNKAHYVVATCIVHRDGRYLITKRAPHELAFPNKWTVPGGKLERRDYTKRPVSTEESRQWYNILEELARREVKEETGVDIANVRYVANLTFIRPDDIPVLVVSLMGDYAGGEVTLCKDMTAHAWVTLEEAKGYDFIEGIYEEIEMVENHRKGLPMGGWKKE